MAWSGSAWRRSRSYESEKLSYEGEMPRSDGVGWEWRRTWSCHGEMLSGDGVGWERRRSRISCEAPTA